VRSRRVVGLCLLVGLLVATSVVPGTHGSPPTLSVASWGKFLTGISLPTLAPGESGVVSFTLQDPLGVPMVGVLLTLGVYEFNAYPGNATGPVPTNGPVFSGTGIAAADAITISVGNLTRNAPAYASPGAVSVAVSVPSGAPEGTYAVRTSLAFLANGSAYLLESRGFFSTAQWENATAPPGAPSTLNVSRLGVSGVIPESGVLVRSNPFPVALAVVLGGALILAAVGGYWALRRGPRSRSGARAGPPPNQAETAFGKSRSSDGD
jgi:hypothetical protein